MRVPLTWLKEFVDITMSPAELAYRLTVAGIEVSKIEYVGVAPAGPSPSDRDRTSGPRRHTGRGPASTSPAYRAISVCVFTFSVTTSHVSIGPR